MMKQRLTALAVIGLSVAALAGCGGKSSAGTGSPAGTQPPTTVAPVGGGGGGGGYSY